MLYDIMYLGWHSRYTAEFDDKYKSDPRIRVLADRYRGQDEAFLLACKDECVEDAWRDALAALSAYRSTKWIDADCWADIDRAVHQALFDTAWWATFNQRQRVIFVDPDTNCLVTITINRTGWGEYFYAIRDSDTSWYDVQVCGKTDAGIIFGYLQSDVFVDHEHTRISLAANYRDVIRHIRAKMIDDYGTDRASVPADITPWGCVSSDTTG